jgi:hypothetical protein
MVTPHAIVVARTGDVYVGSRSDSRILVFDNDLNYKTEFNSFGAPWSMCITSGPHQYIYTSNSNPDNGDSTLEEVAGQVFKIELDGTVVGKWGHGGKAEGQFATLHGLDCRDENVIFTTEIKSWRLQKFILHPTASQTASRGGN